VRSKTVFGDALSACRKKFGYDQGQAARKLGISRATLSAWENGHGVPTRERHLPLVANFLGTDASGLKDLIEASPIDRDFPVSSEYAITPEDWNFLLMVKDGLQQPMTFGLLVELLRRRRAQSESS